MKVAKKRAVVKWFKEGNSLELVEIHFRYRFGSEHLDTVKILRDFMNGKFNLAAKGKK